MLTLSEIRQQYLPKVPELLGSPESVSFEKVATPAVSQEIAALFPLTSSSSAVVGTKGKTSCSSLRIGIVFSGGPAPGGHNVIAGLFDTLAKLGKDHQLFGFLGGPGAIVSGAYRELKAADIAPFRNQGGFDLLGSGRTKTKTPEQFQAVLETTLKLKLDGLVIIGGDDSNTNAANLSEYFLKQGSRISVIGVPKTIDGDIQNSFVPISFGFDTAAKIYSEMIGNLKLDALSSLKYFHFVKLMGRSASHLTLECALKTHPDITLISEEKKSLEQVRDLLVDFVEERNAKNSPYGVVLIPEGLLEMMPGFMLEEGERDSYGNLNLSKIETEKVLIEEVEKELKVRNFKGSFQPIPHFYGYEGRCGHPSNFDANYSYALGSVAALLIQHQYTAMMAYVSNLHKAPSEWTFGGVPFPPLLEIGPQGAVIAKALVDIQGAALCRLRKLENGGQSPGPRQFEGNKEVTDSFPLILQ